jgi:hypothetical protein
MLGSFLHSVGPLSFTNTVFLGAEFICSNSISARHSKREKGIWVYLCFVENLKRNNTRILDNFHR